MFILCTGKVAEKPYSVPYTSTNLYSLEELCYFIYNNIYNITEEFFRRELIIWIRDEIKHQVLAKKCEELMAMDSPDLKDLVVTVLCTSDYYKEEEVRAAVGIIENIVNLPYHLRMKIKSDNYLKYGQYGKAAALYKKLLQGSLAVNFSKEEYGDIMHNLGISHYYISSFRESADDFKEAYIRNHRKESARHYLFVLLLEEEEELFQSEALVMGFSVAEIKELRREFEAAKLPEADGGMVFEEHFLEECKEQLRKAFAL